MLQITLSWICRTVKRLGFYFVIPLSGMLCKLL